MPMPNFPATARTSIRCALLIASVALATPAPAHAALPAPRDVPYPGAITLEVDATDLDRRLLHVHEIIPARPGPLLLLYPEWIPGHHSPANQVRRLAGLRIHSAGRELDWERDTSNPSAFHVEVPAGATSVEIEFQQVLPRTAFSANAALTPDFADVKWHGVVLAPAGYAVARVPVDAALKLPRGWHWASALRSGAGNAAGSGNVAGADAVRFDRVSLETLVDSPVFAGPHYRRVELDPPGTAHPVVLNVFAENETSLVATDAELDAHRSLVQQADRLFGARHFAHYDFLLVLGDTDFGYGLEHHQSSENSSKPGYFTEWARTASYRTLLPHEFTHSWNGKFRRPQDLWTADFNTPMGDSLLWVYEGQTQYWGEVLAARSGVVDRAVELDRIAAIAANAQANRGRDWRDLQDTTFEPILGARGAGRPDWSSWQRGADYYDEGALIWLDVDTTLRERSGGRVSLDDFARGFFGVDDGRVQPLLYRFDDVVAQLQKLMPYDWAGFLRTRLDRKGVAPLDGLERAGWHLAFTDKQSEYQRASAMLRDDTDFYFSLGFRVKRTGELSSVQWDGPAFREGVSQGATLVAVNSRAYTPEGLQSAVVGDQRDGTPIELLIKDGNDYRTVRIDYRDGLRYPRLERVDGRPDLLTTILSPRAS